MERDGEVSKFWQMYDDYEWLKLAGVFDTLEAAADLPLDESAMERLILLVRAWARHAGRYECIGNDSAEQEAAIHKHGEAYPTADGKPRTVMYQPRPVYSDKVVEQPRLELVPITDVLGELAEGE